MESRDRLIIALDLDDQVAAMRLALALRPYFAIAKVGLELFTATGPSIVYSLREAGFKVFIDLKLHDIPTTVNRSARVLGSLGPSFATLHCSGGVEMLKAGVSGLMEGSSNAQEELPIALGVTVLTSEPEASSELVRGRVSMALAAGCQGYVAAAGDLVQTREVAPSLLAVVTGVREAGASSDDQRRPSSAIEAFRSGADFLVLGRTVTGSADPVAAAARLLAGLEGQN